MTTVVTAPLTPKSDPLPHVVKLKVSWKTTRKWTNADVVDYRRSVPMLAERIRTEQYWSKGGYSYEQVHLRRFRVASTYPVCGIERTATQAY
jgi:hypothetical protein